jgi:hypothetical protein
VKKPLLIELTQKLVTRLPKSLESKLLEFRNILLKLFKSALLNSKEGLRTCIEIKLLLWILKPIIIEFMKFRKKLLKESGVVSVDKLPK